MISQKKVEKGYQLILEGLGYNWKKLPHMVDTPSRAAQAMVFEICRGISQMRPKMTTFPLKGQGNMVISRGIPVLSMCAHHLLPFVGVATVAYIPKQRVLGLSKFSRAVDYCAGKPQVQEELTRDIANFLSEALFPQQSDRQDIGVVVRCRHLCMELRGVRHSSDVITSELRGEFMSPEVRAEFLSLAGVR